MNHMWLAYDALVVLTGAVVMALLATVRTRRPFLGAFALFYGCFTLGLLVALSRGYVTLNMTGAGTLPVFLSYGLGMVLGCAALFFAALFGHRALGLRRPWRLAAVAAAMTLAALAMLPPLGVRYDPAGAAYELLAGHFAGATVQLAVFAYILVLLVRALRAGADRYDTLFFAGMGAFAAVGFGESALGLAEAWHAPVGRLDAPAESFLYSSIPYLLFSLFLGAYLGRLLRAPVPAGAAAEQLAADPVPPTMELSAREQEVLGLVLDGLNNKRIASELDISVATVKTHLHNIFRKANVGSRFELARRVEGRRR